MEYNLLIPDLEQIKISIKNIDDSYNNEWDIYAELIQNSIDAIRERAELNKDFKGNIYLSVDCINKNIEITDNGVGISKNELPKLLKLNSTNKRNKTSSIGEKGVGLKFVIYNSNHFEVETFDGNIPTKCLIKNAFNWKDGDNAEPPVLTQSDSNKAEAGTTININDIKLNSNLFELNYNQFKYVLRTKTAFGNTNALWYSDLDITIVLKYIDHTGIEKNDTIPFKYWSPIDNNRNCISLEDFRQKFILNDSSDERKRKAIRGKLVYSKGIKTENNREYSYLAYYFPARSDFNTWSEENGLTVQKDNLNNFDDLDNEYYYAQLTSGIYLSYKGMPTGIKISQPSTGSAGSWPNLFILLEDPKLKFDIGRKKVHGNQENSLKKVAKLIFNDFIKVVQKYGVSEKVEHTDIHDDNNQQVIIEEIKKLPDLNLKNTKFLKIPNKQEAAVAAIFYELIGSGLIKKIIPISSGYKNRYDLYCKYVDNANKKESIISLEFKYDLADLISDINDLKKYLEEITFLVCWEITDETLIKLKRENLDVERLDETALNKFHPATHCLEYQNLKSTYILSLKDFLTREQ